MRLIKVLLVITALSLLATAAWAQTEQLAPAQERTYQSDHASEAGPFAKGSKRVNIVGGIGSNYGETYLIIGGGISYFVADGLSLGLAGEGWILQDPSFWKVSPEARYTFWKMKKFKPYVGAFYRHTFMSDPYDDFDSWGGRAGVTYRKGGSYVSLGVVHEVYLDCDTIFRDCSSTYPEMSFWISF